MDVTVGADVAHVGRRWTKGVLAPIGAELRYHQVGFHEHVDGCQGLGKVAHRDVLATDDVVEVQKRFEVADEETPALAQDMGDLHDFGVFDEGTPKLAEAVSDRRDFGVQRDLEEQRRRDLVDAVVGVVLRISRLGASFPLPCRLLLGSR